MKTKKQLKSENCNSKMNKKEILENMFFQFIEIVFTTLLLSIIINMTIQIVKECKGQVISWAVVILYVASLYLINRKKK